MYAVNGVSTCSWTPFDVHASCKVVPDTDSLQVDCFLGAPLGDIQNFEYYYYT